MSSPVIRWRDLSADALLTDGDEHRAAQLVGGVGEPAPYEPPSARELHALLPFKARERLRRGIWVPVATFVAFNLALAAGRWWLEHHRGSAAVPTATAAAFPFPTEAPAPRVAQSTPRTIQAAPRPTVIRTPTRHFGHASPLPARARMPAPAATPSSSPLGEEFFELATALRQLRREHDPGSALATLVVYRLRFPRGALAGEATALEVDANLASGRRDEALALLNRSLSEGGAIPRSDELRLLRAELLAEDGRCPDALTDFNQLLDSPRNLGSLHARALWGRADCRARTGDLEGSRADYQRYHTEFTAEEKGSQSLKTSRSER